jgi:8-oxo-dGTP diphosphatase
MTDWYNNPSWNRAPKHIISAAATVLNSDGDILLIRSPDRGWEIPGGQVEQGESFRIAVAREIQEESGIHVEVTQFCGIFQTVSRSICNLLFLARPVGGRLSTSEESLEVGWYRLPNALDKITYYNFRERVERCLDQDNHPFMVEYEDV